MRSTKKSTPLTLPDAAPELWPGRCHTDEDLTDYFSRVWGKYLPLLSEGYLREKDARLANAIRKYPVTYGKPWPTRLKIPTQRSRLAAKFKLVQRKGINAVSPKDLIAIALSLARKQKTKKQSARAPAP